MRKTLLVLFLLLFAAACTGASEEPAADTTLDLEDENQRASYAQGLQVGEQARPFPLEIEAFVAGIRDGIADDSRLSDEDFQAAMLDFSRLMTEARAAEAETNLAEGAAWLAENAERPEVQVTESGVQYEVIEEGDGPRPGPDDTVSIHYVGTLIDGTQFDSSYESRGAPITFSVGGVIPGFSEGLQLMPVGATYKIYIPGPLAYGENPQPGGAIGPNDTLIFEVTMLEIVE